MKAKISNRNLFKGGNIDDIFTSLNINSQDITNSYISTIKRDSDRFMFNESYINTYYLHLAIFCYYYEKSNATNRAEYIIAKVDKIKEYVIYYVLYQILNKIMTDDDKDDKYLNAIISRDDFDATPITIDDKEKDFIKIKKILNATAFIIKYIPPTAEIKTKLKDYGYTPEKINTLNGYITEAKQRKDSTGTPKPPPTGQDEKLDKIKDELNNFNLKDVSDFKIYDVTTKAVDFIKKINDDSKTDKVQLIMDGGAAINDLRQAYEGLLETDKAKVKEIGDILGDPITQEAAQSFYNRFNDEYIKREFLLNFQYDAFNNQVTGGAIGEIDDSYLDIVESRFGTIENASDINIYDNEEVTKFEKRKDNAEKGLDNLKKKIDINNYSNKTDIIYKIYDFYGYYITMCDFITDRSGDIEQLKDTARKALIIIRDILKYINETKIFGEDISRIADKYIADTIANLKIKIQPTTTDDFLKKINNTITVDDFNEEKGALLSKINQESPSGDILKIYNFLVKLNKDDSTIDKADIDSIQDSKFRLNAYKYLLMKLLIDNKEDVSSVIDETNESKIIEQLKPLQKGGATDKLNNIFNAYMIMVMNKIMEMDKDSLDTFLKNLQSIEG